MILMTQLFSLVRDYDTLIKFILPLTDLHLNQALHLPFQSFQFPPSPFQFLLDTVLFHSLALDHCCPLKFLFAFLVREAILCFHPLMLTVLISVPHPQPRPVDC